jgi:PilZ domain
MNERRKSPRVRVNLPARWEGALHQETATITDLSKTGCFILSGGSVQVKELIWVEIQLPQGDPVQFWCEVVDAAYEIGFAIKFNAGSDEDETRLNNFIESLFVSDTRKQ